MTKTNLQKAADTILENIVYHAMEARLGQTDTDIILDELRLISEGKVEFGLMIGSRPPRVETLEASKVTVSKRPFGCYVKIDGVWHGPMSFNEACRETSRPFFQEDKKLPWVKLRENAFKAITSVGEYWVAQWTLSYDWRVGIDGGLLGREGKFHFELEEAMDVAYRDYESRTMSRD